MLIAHLRVLTVTGKGAAINLLRAVGNSDSDMAQAEQAAKYLMQYIAASYSIKYFALCNLPGLALAILLQLSTSSWPDLTHLGLVQSQLSAQGVCYVSEGNWALLQQLELSHRCLDEGAMELLVQGTWPHLIWKLGVAFSDGLSSSSHLAAAEAGSAACTFHCCYGS